jgi:tRNA 2-thiocytidine biosynthesis protein TtcA
VFKIKGFLKQKLLLGQVRRAITDYNMIEEGDRIAVGVSGKDSITLLIALAQLQKFFDKKFYLEAITLTLGLGDIDLDFAKKLCEEIGVNYTIKETDIGKIVFEEKREKNPCSLCANMRRGALHNTAKELGCNKVALGHHKDDVIETFMLSLLYEGRLHTFSPIAFLDRKEVYIIRPLILTSEMEIKEFVEANEIIPIDNPCPVEGKTKREEIKQLLASLSQQNSATKENIFGALKRAKINGW